MSDTLSEIDRPPRRINILGHVKSYDPNSSPEKSSETVRVLANDPEINLIPDEEEDSLSFT